MSSTTGGGGATAGATGANGAIDTKIGGGPPRFNNRRALFAQDDAVEYCVLTVNPGHTDMEVERVVNGKKIWRLEGDFNRGELCQWADDLELQLRWRGHPAGPATTISTRITVVSIDTTTWPELHAYLPQGLRFLTRQEHAAIGLALSEIIEGRVDRGQIILRNAGLGPEEGWRLKSEWRLQ